MEDDIFIYLVIAIAIGLFIAPMIDPINTYFSNLKNSVVSFIESNVFYLILLGLFLIFIGICIYFAVQRLKTIHIEKEKKEKDIKKLRQKIQKSLDEDISHKNLEEVLKYVKTLKELKNESMGYNELNDSIDSIENRLSKTKKEYNDAKERKTNQLLKQEREDIKKDIKELEQKQYVKEMYQKENDDTIASKLNTEENPVFKIKDLRIFERESLLRQGYKQLNEYDLVERKIITVLVKSPLNHSPTHTFLVWSAKRLLKKFNGVTNIQDHETKFADITFKLNNKYYALEIETGSLIFHKKRLLEKANFLNSKFNGKWFFIVSNKTLVSKYRNFGPATQRSEVEKKLLKMLEKA
jgi:cell division protein FtsB